MKQYIAYISLIFCLNICAFSDCQAQNSLEDFTWHYYGVEEDCRNIDELIQLFYQRKFEVFKEGTPTVRDFNDSGVTRTETRYKSEKCLPQCSCLFNENGQKVQLSIVVIRSTNPMELAHHFSPAVEQMSKCLGNDWENVSTDASVLKERSKVGKRTFYNEYVYSYKLNNRLLLPYPGIKIIAYMDNLSAEYVIEIQLIS